MDEDDTVEDGLDDMGPVADGAAEDPPLESMAPVPDAGEEAEGAFAVAAAGLALESSPADDGEDRDGEDDAEELPALPFASIVEAILFAAREPLKPAQIARAMGRGTRRDAVRAAVDELNVHYLESGRAFEIAEISGRFQLMSRPEYFDYITRIYPKRDPEEKDKRLSPSARETLAIIAYKQPVTRGEIEHIRGVGCGPALRSLMERGVVKVVGKAQLVGQPWLYGTTEAFLAEFGLGTLDELPLRSEFISIVGDSPSVAEIGVAFEEMRDGEGPDSGDSADAEMVAAQPDGEFEFAAEEAPAQSEDREEGRG